MGLRWGYGGGMEGQSILKRREVSVEEDLCQAGGPNGAFACSIPPKTAKTLYLLHKLLKISELRNLYWPRKPLQVSGLRWLRWRSQGFKAKERSSYAEAPSPANCRLLDRWVRGYCRNFYSNLMRRISWRFAPWRQLRQQGSFQLILQPCDCPGASHSRGELPMG